MNIQEVWYCKHRSTNTKTESLHCGINISANANKVTFLFWVILN